MANQTKTVVYPDRLKSAETLARGGEMRSPDGRHQLIMQDDGNLVVYGPQGARWTPGAPSTGERLIMQQDGNLVLYDTSGTFIWQSGTVGNNGAWLALQDDGNLVLYDASGGKALWGLGGYALDRLYQNQCLLMGGAGLMSNNGLHRLVLQNDGNLVLYGPQGARWTPGAPSTGRRLVLQDGNLVLYGPSGTFIWQSGTGGNNGAWLALQPDGNLVLYDASGKALWGLGGYALDRLYPNQCLLMGGAGLMSNNGLHRLVLQNDGNLVLYGPEGARWTPGAPLTGRRLVLQDGNLVLYDTSGTFIWQSGTGGHIGAWLALQHDGNLVLYDASGKVLWTPGRPGSDTKPAHGTAEAFVQRALAQVGDEYIFGAEANLNDPNPKAFDCSELVQWAAHQVGVSIPDGTMNQLPHIRRAGMTISVDEAVRTRGALLFAPGHVAISLGNGQTIEARGRRHGVNIFSTRNRGWTIGGRIPGMRY
jgi:hypothetical protein